MEFLPAPPFGQLRPAAVIDKVGFTADKTRAAGKVAGTLVSADELPYGLEKGPAILLCPFRPFLRLGLNDIKTPLGR
jgi:4-hydroxy-2-oxoheptanedioate aldolase